MPSCNLTNHLDSERGSLLWFAEKVDSSSAKNLAYARPQISLLEHAKGDRFGSGRFWHIVQSFLVAEQMLGCFDSEPSDVRLDDGRH
jgi:hypothetical protein